MNYSTDCAAQLAKHSERTDKLRYVVIACNAA